MDQFGLNASFVKSLRAQWIEDPGSVAEEWRHYFEQYGAQHSLDDEPAMGPHAVGSPARHEVFGRDPNDTKPPMPAAPEPEPAFVPGPDDDAQTLRGIAAAIAAERFFSSMLA